MKMVLPVIGVIVGMVVFLTIETKAQNVKEGKWSMTMVTTIEGMDAEMAEMQAAMADMSPEEKAMMQQMMGGMDMGVNADGITTTVTQCISDENPVPDMEGQENCKQTHSVNGNTINFEVTCKDSRSIGRITYTGDAMTGEVQSHQTENGKPIYATIQITGQYVGPCS